MNFCRTFINNKILKLEKKVEEEQSCIDNINFQYDKLLAKCAIVPANKEEMKQLDRYRSELKKHTLRIIYSREKLDKLKGGTHCG